MSFGWNEDVNAAIREIVQTEIAPFQADINLRKKESHNRSWRNEDYKDMDAEGGVLATQFNSGGWGATDPQTRDTNDSPSGMYSSIILQMSCVQTCAMGIV